MVFYRYENSGERVSLRKYNMLRETPCGYWIQERNWCVERWISKTTRKRYAYPTQEEAMVSFKARKSRQILLLSGQLENAKRAYSLVDREDAIEAIDKNSGLGTNWRFTDEY